MKTIVAVDNNWGIGKDGGLLVHLPGDLKYFKEKTLGKVVVMGRTTFESFPGKKPLKDRVNIVLSRNEDFRPADCIKCKSMGELFKVLENYDMEDVFIIGGEDIYRQFSPYCSSHLVTKINADFDADKHFENLDQRSDLELATESQVQNDNGVEYRFTEYKRK
ncbi:MAG TPA: dihydrofolate reductase [Anaerovoracaceae bacterium]|nr:dihydrofolate reductase [Anaerovoracaceae bacterium]